MGSKIYSYEQQENRNAGCKSFTKAKSGGRNKNSRQAGKLQKNSSFKKGLQPQKE
jgi:hypothetical protein